MVKFSSNKIRRREVLCFWAGICTATMVVVYRIYITALTARYGVIPQFVSMDTWTINFFTLWALILFVLAWLFWRDALRRQDEFATVMRSIRPEVLIVTDAAGIIWMCNPAVKPLLGFEPEALIGKKVDTLLQDRNTSGDERLYYAKLRTPECDVRPAFGLHQHGSRIPIEVTTSRLIEQSGSVILIRDIAERRRVEQLRDNLTHMLVHDLRNPLFGIGGNLHLVRELAGTLSPEANASILSALDFVRDMGEMLRCLVVASQLESGVRIPLPGEADIGELIDRALATLATLIADKRHTVSWSRAPLPLRCDAELIERVALNLIRNAVEATPSDGTIEIRAWRTPRHLRVEVRDSGPGVPHEFQKLVFEKFGQTPDGRKAKRRSTGLGLFYCKLAVEAHGGAIGLESDLDMGSTFWFELPDAPAKPSPPSVSQPDPMERHA